MTPFMMRVSDVVHGQAAQSPPLTDSIPRTVGQGAHEQVELRALAEQLVAEANAVLPGEPVLLEDGSGTRDQRFSLSYGGSWAHVVTSFEGATAHASLQGSQFPSPRKELTDGEALGDLILTLIAVGR